MVFCSTNVAPTASETWIATSWATFFSMSFCLKSPKTYAKSYLVICLSPTTFLILPTHLFKNEFLLVSSSLSSSLSKKPAIFSYFSSSMYFSSCFGDFDLSRIDERSNESITFLSILLSNDSLGLTDLSSAYSFLGLFDVFLDFSC